MFLRLYDPHNSVLLYRLSHLYEKKLWIHIADIERVFRLTVWIFSSFAYIYNCPIRNKIPRFF